MKRAHGIAVAVSLVLLPLSYISSSQANIRMLGNRMIIAGSVLYVSLAGILLYVRLLLATNLSATIFHALFVSATISTTLLVLSRSLSVKTRLIVVISWIVTLQLVTPLRLPDSILSNYPDAWYMKQIVDQITNSGSNFIGYGTGQAYLYSLYPISQLFMGIFLLVTGAEPITFMKFLPSLLSAPCLAIVFNFYQRFTSQDDALLATLISGSCFWYVNFASRPVQSVFGIFFGAIVLLALARKTTAWRIIFVLGAVALGLSHLTTAIYTLVLLVIAGSYMAVQHSFHKSTQRMPLSLAELAILASIIFVWLAFSAMAASRNIIEIAIVAFNLATMRGTHFALYQGLSEAGNPYVPRILGDTGVLLYGLLALIGFFYLSIRRKTSSLIALVPYALGAAVIFGVQVLLFSAFPTLDFIVDLLPRAFFWVYLLASPLVVFVFRLARGPRQNSVSHMSVGLEKTLNDHVGSGRIQRHEIRSVLFCSVAILILLSSMYYYYPAFRYDNSMAMNYEDVRLPLEEWRIAGSWALSHLGATDAYGDKLAFNFIGAIGHKQVHLFPSRGTLLDWLDENTGIRMIVLRMSLVEAPYEDLVVTDQQLALVLESNNVVYTGGDPVIIISRGST